MTNWTYYKKYTVSIPNDLYTVQSCMQGFQLLQFVNDTVYCYIKQYSIASLVNHLLSETAILHTRLANKP